MNLSRQKQYLIYVFTNGGRITLVYVITTKGVN